jgi:hypothetical protein
MKIYAHLLKDLAEFFIGWEIFQTNIVEKNKTYFYNQ